MTGHMLTFAFQTEDQAKRAAAVLEAAASLPGVEIKHIVSGNTARAACSVKHVDDDDEPMASVRAVESMLALLPGFQSVGREFCLW